MGLDRMEGHDLLHYKQHIKERVVQTDHAYPRQLEADHASCACIDSEANQKAEHVFAGGGVRIFLEQGKPGFLAFLDKWADKGGVLKAHLYCGWMLLVRGMSSEAAQREALKAFEETVQEWNTAHPDKPGFTTEIEWEKGTARPYMAF